MRKLLIFCIILFLPNHSVFSQVTGLEISGKVYSDGEVVPFATVGLLDTKFGALSDEKGSFRINSVPPGVYKLQVSSVGYQIYTKQITVGKQSLNIAIELQKSRESLGEVVVTGTLKESFTLQSPIHVEVYTPKLFRKNPTPSIFEALQMVNGVQPQLNCNVCNTGDIHINGMEGPYTMITLDGMPIVSSLASVYGLSGIPNSMIKRIEVVKGPASTLYGSEAVGGLINIITKSPMDAPKIAVDVMASSHREFNADVAFKAGFKKAQALFGINAFSFQNRRDVNHDNFTDITLQQRISVFNKWNFSRPENRVASLAARYLYEDRWGGEMNWKPEFRGGDSIYGESIYTKRLEVIGNYQLPFREKLNLQVSFNTHNQNSAYGNMFYKADQHIAFAQLLWDRKFNRHDLLIGLPFRYTFYDDNTVGTQTATGLNNPQQILLPGIFVQDEITLTDKLTGLAGLRYDLNSEHGGIFSPRASIKFSPREHTVFRLNAGNGYRVVNLFTEDHAALTGSRDVVIAENLQPERSWNGSLNVQKFIDLKSGFLGVDGSVFYTYFTNRITGDFLTDPNLIIYKNLEGYAVSRGITLNADWSFIFPLKINAGATFMEVYTMQENAEGKLERLPQLHAPKVSATYAISYTINKLGLTLDYTGRLYGPMHLPVLENDFRPEKSPWFGIDNFQLTKKLPKNFEVYAGIKNLYNFLPQNPIMRPFDPFDKHIGTNNPQGYTFDTTYNYAPMQGRRFFLGMRWQLS